MMRTPNFWELAKEHNLHLLRFEDLQDYAWKNENHVKKKPSCKSSNEIWKFRIHGYINDITGRASSSTGKR